MSIPGLIPFGTLALLPRSCRCHARVIAVAQQHTAPRSSFPRRSACVNSTMSLIAPWTIGLT
eukprot:4162208-Amphidinium_carterae.1